MCLLRKVSPCILLPGGYRIFMLTAQSVKCFSTLKASNTWLSSDFILVQKGQEHAFFQYWKARVLFIFGKYSQSSLFADSVFVNLLLTKIFFCNPKCNTQGTFSVIPQYVQSSEKFESLKFTFPAEVRQGDLLLPRSSSHTVNKCLVCALFGTILFVGDFALENGL